MACVLEGGLMNIPNLLTLARISLIPLFVCLFYMPWHFAQIVTIVIFVVAALTDWLDGYLARSLSQTSRLGAFLDPVADKLIVVTALILLVGENQFPYIAVPAAVIAGREIAISALREWMAELGKRTSIAVSILGKSKTVLQMLAITLLLIGRSTTIPNHELLAMVGYGLLYAAAVMTLWSMVIYLKTAWPELKA